MSTAISPQPSSTHLSTSQTALKPCQRSCKGLLLYFPPTPQHGAANRDNSATWRSSEPTCFGLSSPLRGPNLDLKKLHEAREVPAGQHVDWSIVLGHAVFQANNDAKGLPPGCMTGLEFMRFCKMPMNTVSASSTVSDDAVQSGSALSASAVNTTAAVISSAVQAITGSLKGFASGFRIMTSDDDTNQRLNKTWSSIVNFDPQQYASKLEAQAHKNLGSMTKWLRDLQNAVSKPKP